jgi:hypothetical protein
MSKKLFAAIAIIAFGFLTPSTGVFANTVEQDTYQESSESNPPLESQLIAMDTEDGLKIIDSQTSPTSTNIALAPPKKYCPTAEISIGSLR